MKSSRYNRFTTADDGMIVAFNAVTGALASLSENQYSIADQILSSPDGFVYDSEEKQKLRDDLMSAGFLLEDSLDEFNLLKTRSRIERFQTNNASVTIALTSKCNFRCPYCFEDVANGETAHGEVLEAIGKYVVSKIESGLKHLDVTWFGGEPLLCMHSMEKLASLFYERCQALGCGYSSMAITNGYLLTREAAARLKAAHVEAVQITIDGPGEMHDKRRFLANGQGSYRQIIENIKKCHDIMPVGIRVNVDDGNAGRLGELLDDLDKEGLRGCVSIYFAPVEEYTDVTKDTCGGCMDMNRFSKLQIDLELKMLEMGFGRPKSPKPRMGFCTADRSNSVVIGPDGSLYACYTHIGNEAESIGDVFDGQLNYNSIKWLSWDPFEKEICSKCEVLPLCMGGCLVEGFKEPDLQKGHCEVYKYALDDHLRLYYYAQMKYPVQEEQAAPASEYYASTDSITVSNLKRPKKNPKLVQLKKAEQAV